MATRILSTIGVAVDLTLYLATKLEPNSTVDRYINGRGMNFGLDDQKPQPQAPQPLLGLFFPAASFCCCRHLVQAARFKMKPPKKPEKYTVKHINEITDRMTALRMRWLRHVETQLASQQSRPAAAAAAPALDHYKLSTEAAE